ncbi:hypothetical protein Micbo1qcDRAFT_201891 [Microdochium bolleyi]|uniref:Uncharacterized protein n=1 Tax=Microdochium bolleyi TaxID=196109 RepID=A0A136J9Z3_9PEZI|nr:hypothetical protein Micbo1qcDRAFT_201891 [Microdochium bolleyi]
MHDTTFFTRTIPDIPSNAYIIGLCSIPDERAQPDDQGWHLADFLAWKTLFRGHGTANSQAWLAFCDVAQIVKARPADFAHGSDRVIVKRALAASFDNIPGVGLRPQYDYVHVDSAATLGQKFLDVVAKFSEKAHKADAPLVIFLCGPSNLGQDVYLEDKEDTVWIRSCQIRKAMPESGIKAVVVNAAPFSPGWQINPSFCTEVPFKPLAAQTTALGMQLGGLFTRRMQDVYLGWDCPWLDKTRVDTEIMAADAFPSPLLLQTRQQESIDSVKHGLFQFLSGRLIGFGLSHSFNFDANHDDWVTYIRPRVGLTLANLESKWERLPKALPADTSPPKRLGFLGSAFGGCRSSQLSHIRHLVLDDLATTGSWENTSFDRDLKRNFERVLKLLKEDPDELDCHELFCLLEHRATSVVLGDLLLRQLGMQKWAPAPGRCHDWDRTTWKRLRGPMQQTAEVKLVSVLQTKLFPSFQPPPPLALDNHRHMHRRLSACSEYLTAAIIASGEQADLVVADIQKVLHQAVRAQMGSLETKLKFRDFCISWLEAINMPTVTTTGSQGSEAPYCEAKPSIGANIASHLFPGLIVSSTSAAEASRTLAGTLAHQATNTTTQGSSNLPQTNGKFATMEDKPGIRFERERDAPSHHRTDQAQPKESTSPAAITSIFGDGRQLAAPAIQSSTTRQLLDPATQQPSAPATKTHGVMRASQECHVKRIERLQCELNAVLDDDAATEAKFRELMQALGVSEH